MSDHLQAAIGKHADDSSDLDWLDYWPLVDENGIVEAVLDTDGINLLDNYVMVDFENGKPVKVDGYGGFEGVMRV